jgi:hypothetical protein
MLLDQLQNRALCKMSRGKPREVFGDLIYFTGALAA